MHGAVRSPYRSPRPRDLPDRPVPGEAGRYNGLMRRSLSIPLGTLAVGAAGLAYAAGVEVNLFRLRRFTVPVLPAGSAPLRILQVSDIHMVPGQRRKQEGRSEE